LPPQIASKGQPGPLRSSRRAIRVRGPRPRAAPVLGFAVNTATSRRTRSFLRGAAPAPAAVAACICRQRAGGITGQRPHLKHSRPQARLGRQPQRANEPGGQGRFSKVFACRLGGRPRPPSCCHGDGPGPREFHTPTPPALQLPAAGRVLPVPGASAQLPQGPGLPNCGSTVAIHLEPPSSSRTRQVDGLGRQARLAENAATAPAMEAQRSARSGLARRHRPGGPLALPRSARRGTTGPVPASRARAWDENPVACRAAADLGTAHRR